MTLVIIHHDGEVVLFQLPVNVKVPPKVSKLAGYEIYGGESTVDERILLHKFFGIALDDFYPNSQDTQRVEKQKQKTPLFDAYRLPTGAVNVDTTRTLVYILTSDT